MKKFLSLILCLAMLFALCVPAFADEQEETYNYVCFGASNTNGFGLHGYLSQPFYDYIGTSAQIADWKVNKWNAAAWNPDAKMDDANISGYLVIPEGCYPDLIRDSLEAEGKNVQLNQFAMSSMRVEELRVLLDNTYEGDSFTKWRFYDPNKTDLAYDRAGGVDVMRNQVQSAVADADLITYDMGANNFGVYLSMQLMDGKFDNNFADIYGEETAAKFYDMRARVESAVTSVLGDLLDESTFATVDEITDTLAYALLGYCYNFDQTMGKIRQLNQNADIVVISIQNVVADLVVSYNGIKIPFGEVLSSIINMANVYMMSGSEYSDEYCFANVSDNGHVEFFYDEIKNYNGDPYSLNEAYIDCFNCLDNTIHVQAEVTQLLEKKGILPGSAEYEKALYAAYDAIATMFSESAKIDVMPLDDMLSGDRDINEAEDYLMDSVCNAYTSAAIAAIETPDTPFAVDAVVDELFSDDLYRAIANYGARTSLGNCFFAHPSYNGHIQLRDAVLNALEDKTSGNEALILAAIELKGHLAELGVTYGIDAVKLLAEKILTAMGVENASEALDKLVDTDEVADYIISVAGLNTAAELETAEKLIDQFSYVLKAHQHSLVYVPAKSATLLSSGHSAYYVCTGCGKLFSDSKGLNKITLASTVIPSKLSTAVSKLFR